jgi:YD repeat-containing protein
VQYLNRDGLRGALRDYSVALLEHIRANRPAATLADLVGGYSIIPAEEQALRQTTLPYQVTAVPTTRWDEIPAGYSSYLVLSYQGISKVYTSDQLAGKRLTISYDGTTPVLMLDGAVEAVGNDAAPGTRAEVAFSIVHGAYAGLDNYFTQSITAGGTYLIGNAWGPVERAAIEHHRRRLLEARDGGAAEDAEPVLGSTLAMLAATWVAQTNRAIGLADQLGGSNTLLHHQVGIAGYNGAPYVDLPGITISTVHRQADQARERAAYLDAAMHGSVLESTAVEQVSGIGAVSTAALLDIAVRDGLQIYDVDIGNYNAVAPSLTDCDNSLASLGTAVAGGARLILPQSCALTQNQWQGIGYYDLRADDDSYRVGAVINGDLLGGFGDQPQPAPELVEHAQDSGIDPYGQGQQNSGQSYNDPIDMVHGHYLYARTDLTTGTGGFPSALTVGRTYSSGLRQRSGPLGRGWVHDLDITAKPGADGFQALGEDSALDAAASVVETLIALDLLSQPDRPLEHLVIASLGKAWVGEQAVDNTVLVQQGVNSEVFTRLPDGSFNPPPGHSARLIDNGDGTYGYETLNRALLTFDAEGRAASYQEPTGIQVRFDYTADKLTGVRNSLGRALTLSYTGDKLTAVSDGQRSIAYGFDADDNLVSFTDAEAAETRFVYDPPGRITQVFYPSHPDTPFLTNTYDSLGRVRTQTDANPKSYEYFFAGIRSEEQGPDGQRRIDFPDAFGNIVKSIDPLGRETRTSYDGQQRPIETTLPDGRRITYAYDDATCAAQDQCTHNLARLERHPIPGSDLPVLATSFTYDAAFNQLASHTDPRGNTWSYTYTGRGEPLTIAGPPDADGERPLTTYGYADFTAAGFPSFSLPVSVSRRIDATSSVTTTTTYDAANGFVPATSTIDPGGLALATSFGYDAVGNLTRVDGPRTDFADVTQFAYDAERRLVQTTDAAGKRGISAYDADGRLIRSAAEAPAGWLVACRDHTPSGKLARAWGPAETASPDTCPATADPVPVTDYAYDSRDRVARITRQLPVEQGGPRISEIDYLPDDRIQAERNAVGTADAQATARYSYTESGRLASVQDANGNLSAYDYDGHDRPLRLRYPSPTTPGTASTSDYEQYGYDAAGNLTTLRLRSGETTRAGLRRPRPPHRPPLPRRHRRHPLRLRPARAPHPRRLRRRQPGHHPPLRRRRSPARHHRPGRHRRTHHRLHPRRRRQPHPHDLARRLRGHAQLRRPEPPRRAPRAGRPIARPLCLRQPLPPHRRHPRQRHHHRLWLQRPVRPGEPRPRPRRQRRRPDLQLHPQPARPDHRYRLEQPRLPLAARAHRDPRLHRQRPQPIHQHRGRQPSPTTPAATSPATAAASTATTSTTA